MISQGVTNPPTDCFGGERGRQRTHIYIRDRCGGSFGRGGKPPEVVGNEMRPTARPAEAAEIAHSESQTLPFQRSDRPQSCGSELTAVDAANTEAVKNGKPSFPLVRDHCPC